MTFSQVQVGRITLTEALAAASEQVDGDGTRTLSISGQESSPPSTSAAVAAVVDDVLGLQGALVPVVFEDKADRSGFCTVTGASAETQDWQGEIRTVAWSLELVRHGPDAAVDLESRLSGAQTRVNSHSITGERWHAPPAGHYGYHTSSGTPSTLSVTGAEGALTVYRALTVGVHPLWGCALDDYGTYRARLLDGDGRERAGTLLTLPTTGWEVHNSLVKVTATAAGLVVSSHDGTSWAAKTYEVSIDAGTALAEPEAVSVVRNDYHNVTVRLLWSRSPGRVEVDLTVRRGSRLVEAYARVRPSATSIAVSLASAEATTAGTGYITATGDDANGDRYILGSAGAYTASTGDGSITKASAASMDWYMGCVIGGGSAPSGDQATDLRNRYVGTVAEQVTALAR